MVGFERSKWKGLQKFRGLQDRRAKPEQRVVRHAMMFGYRVKCKCTRNDELQPDGLSADPWLSPRQLPWLQSS